MSKAYRCVQGGGRGGKRLCVRTQFAFFYKGKLTKNHFITTLKNEYNTSFSVFSICLFYV